MIKLIRTDQLQPGMYIHDLNCEWIEHNFLRNRFKVDSEAAVGQVRAIGVKELYIDTSKGFDVADAPTREEAQQSIDRQLAGLAQAAPAQARVTALEEAHRARQLQREAGALMRAMMDDIRRGRHIELEKIEPAVDRIVDSVFRQQDALLPLARLKSHDEYTFRHSVSVCALMVAFARTLELPRATIRELAVGALLHDVGKAHVPGGILNKPGKLTDAEFDHMKSHVVQSAFILRHTPGISAVALDVAAQHHERFDGTGYPHRLKEDAISVHGQMGAIIDVYDAITSNRVYHQAMAPTRALRKLLEWSKFHFNPKLVHAFIRSVGVYPAGSLVRLESGRLAVVQEQNSGHGIQPIVKVIFHARLGHYLRPEIVDLTKSQDAIAGDESFEKWHIDPARWLPA